MDVFEELENADRLVFQMVSHSAAISLVVALAYLMARSYSASLGSSTSLSSSYLDCHMFAHHFCARRFTYHRFFFGCEFHSNRKTSNMCCLNRMDLG